MKECNHCGGLGYTIEINAEGVEYMDGCDPCRIEAIEADPMWVDLMSGDYTVHDVADFMLKGYTVAGTNGRLVATKVITGRAA